MIEEMTSENFRQISSCHDSKHLFCFDVFRCFAVLHLHFQIVLLFQYIKQALKTSVVPFYDDLHKHYCNSRNTIQDWIHHCLVCFHLYGLYMANYLDLVKMLWRQVCERLRFSAFLYRTRKPDNSHHFLQISLGCFCTRIVRIGFGLRLYHLFRRDPQIHLLVTNHP